MVNLQYYTNIGTIKDNEIVELVREPENPTDSNAIKVLNLGGKQLGYIQPSIAELLAPFVDKGSISIEGFVPKSIPFVYEMLCQIYVSTHKNSMPKILKSLTEAGLDVITSLDPDAEEEKVQNPEEEKIQDQEEEKFQNPKEAPNLEENAIKQNGAQELINLGLPKRRKESSATVVAPLLQPHEKALAWMVDRENSNSLDLQPFWHVSSESGMSQETLYKNVLTIFEKIERPSPLRGGVLAYEMGSERTLILISLVATNPLIPNRGNPLNPTTENLVNLNPENKVNSSLENPLIPKSGNPLNPNPTNSSPKRKRDGRERSGNSTPKKTNADTYKELTLCSKKFVKNDFEPVGVCKTTLVICPSSALSIWTRQLEERTMLGSLKAYLYLGDHCNKISKELCKFDVVLSTYRTLGLELDCPSSLMLEMEWSRVILDEAQFLNNSGTKEAKAAIALKAQRRWATISTPTENTSLNLFLVLDFLKFQPSSIQMPLGQGSTICQSDLQALTDSLGLRRTKGLNEHSPVIGKAVINVEGSDGYIKDGQSSLEAKKIEEKRGKEEQKEVEETLYETTEAPIQAVINIEGSDAHSSDGQSSLEAKQIEEKKGKGEQEEVEETLYGTTEAPIQAVINIEGSDGHSSGDQSSLEAKQIEEKKEEEEQEEVEETLYEATEAPIQTSPKIERGAQARAYFGDLEGINFDLNITTTPLHDLVEGPLYADEGRRLQTSEVADVGPGVADVNQQPITIDSEASLENCAPSYEDNQVEVGKKEDNEEDGDNKDDDEDSDDSRFDSLGAMMEAAETSSLSRDQAKKLLLRMVNVALRGDDPWQERTIKLIEDINKMQVEMTSLRNCVPLKNEVVKKYAKYIQCEDWNEILLKAWEEANRVSGNESGLLDVQSTKFCDDPVLAPAIYTLRWMVNVLKQRVEVTSVYHAYGYDMQCRNEELTKSLDVVKEELLGVKEELEETKASLACSITTANEDRREQSQLREKMERDLADLRRENEQMKKEKEEILQASKVLYEENKDLVKKLIGASYL
ncbi:hypothetical protein KI387_025268 [Taxus chinensis]|uniref:Helicase ATP-binding domain-containing protein n=1 Tax=Taxus chinensis TaxID=29808 RepID=A0AA38LAD7_TAXCH|nr:hypothetical protein KI387_025268 [Taxus chinensis]